MSDIKSLLEYRKKLKARKPDFIRQDAHKRPALGRKWRRPRGIQSKMRKHLHGYRKSVSTGYSSPRAVKGMHKSGLKPTVVQTLEGIKALGKGQGAVIGHVGMKRKLELLRYAAEKNIAVLNVKDPKAYLAKAEEDRKKTKEEKTSKLQEKKHRQEDLKKAAKAKEAEKKEGVEALTEEGKKEDKKEQVREAEKVLTKRE